MWLLLLRQSLRPLNYMWGEKGNVEFKLQGQRSERKKGSFPKRVQMQDPVQISVCSVTPTSCELKSIDTLHPPRPRWSVSTFQTYLWELLFLYLTFIDMWGWALKIKLIWVTRVNDNKYHVRSTSTVIFNSVDIMCDLVTLGVMLWSYGTFPIH